MLSTTTFVTSLCTPTWLANTKTQNNNHLALDHLCTSATRGQKMLSLTKCTWFSTRTVIFDDKWWGSTSPCSRLQLMPTVINLNCVTKFTSHLMAWRSYGSFFSSLCSWTSCLVMSAYKLLESPLKVYGSWFFRPLCPKILMPEHLHIRILS